MSEPAFKTAEFAAIEQRLRSRRSEHDQTDAQSQKAAGLFSDFRLFAKHIGDLHSTLFSYREYYFSLIPSCSHISSTRVLTSDVMTMGRPHSRSVSAFHLWVASMPSLPPRPDFGEAKSR